MFGSVAVASTAAVASTFATFATSACGRNSQPSESAELLTNFMFPSSKKEDGLKWGGEVKYYNNTNKKRYTEDIKIMLINLAIGNPNFGILIGDQINGWVDSLKRQRNIHIFWAFGVGEHQSYHTSLAFLYKSCHSTQEKFVMMKVDLQVVPVVGDGSSSYGSSSHSENQDMTTKESVIYINHEVKVVNGINKHIWSKKKGVYKMSINDIVDVLLVVMNRTDPIYDIINNNCIQFKNDILEEKSLLSASVDIMKIPEKDKVEDTILEGIVMTRVYLDLLALECSNPRHSSAPLIVPILPDDS